MIVENGNISTTVYCYFKENKSILQDIKTCNSFLAITCGIVSFFESEEQLRNFSLLIFQKDNFVHDSRREYGDFQTNQRLALENVKYILLKSKNKDFEFLLEPNCGKGNFIIAALCQIPSLKRIVGVEIYQPYVWEAKLNILDFFIRHPGKIKPDIEIVCANVFEYDFEKLSTETMNLKTLIIGNPPWITNSELGSINSKNLPQKSNFKNYSGYDSITGKSNFDISEYISLLMLKKFSSHNGVFSFLLKNIVVKNLIYDQKKNNFTIGENEKLYIDSKKEFNVSVDACLFITKLNQYPGFSCSVKNFYTQEEKSLFGWVKDKFVYSIKKYHETKEIDGKSIFIWRQGIKHDCSKIMEIERYNGHFINGFNEEVIIEHDLVYGLLKSSDLKRTQINSYRKLLIVTQHKIGQETEYIKNKFPLTYSYLKSN